MDLNEKRKNLPSCPGVYLMKDSLDNIIYVGKSKNLKSRVGSYFQNSKSHSPKVLKLIKNLKDFDYILTDTEFEAFMLECKLIKEIKPTYNRLMKSPIAYSYIKINTNAKYPCIEISNEYNENDGNIYFGPYASRSTVEKGLNGIREHYKILCNNSPRKSSSCLNYSLGLCIGMCFDSSKNEQYISILNKVIALLNGIDKSTISEIADIMNEASEKFNFEIAAKYRDYINAINYLLSTENVVKFTKVNRSLALIQYLDENAFKLFLIKENKVLFSEKYNKTNSSIETLTAIIKTKILYYYKSADTKDSIVIEKDAIDEAQIIYSYIKNNSSTCKHILIRKTWFNTKNSIAIDKAINKLICE